MKSESATIETRAIEHYFLVVLFVIYTVQDGSNFGVCGLNP